MRRICICLVAVVCGAMASDEIAHAQETITQGTISGCLTRRAPRFQGRSSAARQTNYQRVCRGHH